MEYIFILLKLWWDLGNMLCFTKYMYEDWWTWPTLEWWSWNVSPNDTYNDVPFSIRRLNSLGSMPGRKTTNSIIYQYPSNAFSKYEIDGKYIASKILMLFVWVSGWTYWHNALAKWCKMAITL